jgi:Flp pilus assembly protein TadG
MFQEWKTKFALGANRFLPARLAQRLARREDGAAAVEFALVAAPFLALLFAIIETSLIFFAGQTLETATADASRLIMTGQQQSKTVPPGSDPVTEFKKNLCYDPPPGSTDQKVVLPMFKCANLMVQVVSADSVGYSSGSTTTSGLGGPGCIVTVQVTYDWPVYVSLLNLSYTLAGGKWDGKHQLKATAVFRNEPYGNSSGC